MLISLKIPIKVNNKRAQPMKNKIKNERKIDNASCKKGCKIKKIII